jgi:hypothetical protein
VIADEVGQTLFEIEWLLDTADMPRSVFDPDKHRPSRRIGKCDEAAEHSVGGGQITLELERFPLCTFEQVEKVHELRSIL